MRWQGKAYEPSSFPGLFGHGTGDGSEKFERSASSINEEEPLIKMNPANFHCLVLAVVSNRPVEVLVV
jgi:hypothetical protein